jgi:DNA repair protein RadC
MNASAIIAAHNHPSGVAEPSESDRLLTQDLIAAERVS